MVLVAVACSSRSSADEVAANFVCPLEDVLAYAEMIGMDVQEDLDLLVDSGRGVAGA